VDKPPLLTPDEIDTAVAERMKKQAVKAKGRKGARRQRSESEAAPAERQHQPAIQPEPEETRTAS
jgi:hypothetical protein